MASPTFTSTTLERAYSDVAFAPRLSRPVSRRQSSWRAENGTPAERPERGQTAGLEEKTLGLNGFKDIPILYLGPSEPPKPIIVCGLKRSRFDAAWLGISYCFLFLAYSVTQAFLSTLFPGSGLVSLALIYGVLGVSSLIVPVVVSLPPVNGDLRLAIFAGGVIYLNLMIAAGVGNTPYLLVSSAFTGFGAAMVWVNQGIYLEAVARTGVEREYPNLNERMGLLEVSIAEQERRTKRAISQAAGTFWFLCSISGILGNSVGMSVLASGATPKIMIWTFVGIAGVALVMLFFANSEYREYRCPDAERSEKRPSKLTTAWEDALDLLKFLRTHLALLLLPIFMMKGAAQAFTVGILPMLIAPEDGGPRALTFYFLCHATSATIAAPSAARIFGLRGGWAWVTLLCGIALASELMLSAFEVSGIFGEPGPTAVRQAALALTACSSGIFDASINALINCTLMKLSFGGPRPSVMFSAYQAASCLLGFVPMSVIATTRPVNKLGTWWSMVEIGIASLYGVAAVSFSVLNLLVAKVRNGNGAESK